MTNREHAKNIYLKISENLQKSKNKIVKELVQKAVDDGQFPCRESYCELFLYCS